MCLSTQQNLLSFKRYITIQMKERWVKQYIISTFFNKKWNIHVYTGWEKKFMNPPTNPPLNDNLIPPNGVKNKGGWWDSNSIIVFWYFFLHLINFWDSPSFHWGQFSPTPHPSDPPLCIHYREAKSHNTLTKRILTLHSILMTSSW